MAAVQVFVFGHPLSEQTKQYLSTLGEVKVHKILLHVPQFCDTLPYVKSVFEELQAQGADLSGKTKTIMVPPGSSVAAMALVGGWIGLAGEAPKLLNLIKDPGGATTDWVPSPEAPILDLQSFRCNMRLTGRRNFHAGVETISAKADRAVSAN